jgi:lipopolysaccharide export system protein LptC
MGLRRRRFWPPRPGHIREREWDAKIVNASGIRSARDVLARCPRMDRLTNAYGTDDRNAHLFTADNRGDSERIFRAALRHSRHVHFLRLGIPIGVVIVTLMVVIGVWFNPLRSLTRLPIGLGNLVISGSKITMESPRLSGYTSDSRAYELTARAAAQDLRKPQLMELSDLHAKVEMQNKSMVEVTATAGVYDTKSEMLTLGPKIVLTSTTGYAGYLSEAVIDVRKGDIVSTKPVTVKLLNGTLDANGLKVIKTGEILRFEGGVKMILDLSKSATAAAPNEKKP